MFKNPSYLCVNGDINKDQYFDVCDLVYMDTMKEYYYLADYDKNGSINDLDLAELKLELLDRVAAEKTVKKIARIGYRPYDSSTPPEQSLASYRMAYQMGYEILLCDVRTTKDGHFVALHDATINSYSRNSAGESMKNKEAVNINDITLAEADTYDFGIYKGSQYAGTKIMRVEEFIALCKELGVTTHLELKETFSEDKLDELVALIKSYGVENDLMINGQNADNLRYLADKLPNAAMGTWVVNITDTLINQIATYGENNPKFIYVSNGGEASITPENYAKCQAKGVDIAYTEIKTEEALQEFKDLGLLDYCKYIATRYDLY
jgi:glycerophosphoryl diester phosphodiesterase